MKKGLLVFILIFVLALGLTACSQPTSAPTTAPGGGSTSPTTGNSTGLDGATILQNACQSCHGLGIVTSQHQDTAGWTRTVDNMINRGASLSADERTALIAYLAATYK
jgi:cytochrome c5